MIRLFFLFLLLIPVFAHAQTTSDPMRGLIWGLPIEEVAKFEKGTFVSQDENRLFYMDNMHISDVRVYPALIEYHFTQHRLDRIRYDFTVNTIDPQKTLDDLMFMQQWLEDAFGQEGEPVFSFRRNDERNDPAIWGWAIYRGGASVKIDWNIPGTGARLRLTGNDYIPDMTLVLNAASSAPNP